MDTMKLNPVPPSRFDEAFLEERTSEEKTGEEKDIDDVRNGNRIEA